MRSTRKPLSSNGSKNKHDERPQVSRPGPFAPIRFGIGPPRAGLLEDGKGSEKGMTRGKNRDINFMA